MLVMKTSVQDPYSSLSYYWFQIDQSVRLVVLLNTNYFGTHFIFRVVLVSRRRRLDDLGLNLTTWRLRSYQIRVILSATSGNERGVKRKRVL